MMYIDPGGNGTVDLSAKEFTRQSFASLGAQKERRRKVKEGKDARNEHIKQEKRRMD